MRRSPGGSMGLQTTGRWEGWGFRRAVAAFTILEEIAAPPPDIPAPLVELRSKLRIGNDATAPLPNVWPLF